MNAEQIQAKLRHHHHAAQALVELLDQECAAVIAGDAGRLTALAARKEQDCQALATLGPCLENWLQGRELSHWLQSQGENIQREWAQLSAQLALCQRKNDANGLLISQRQSEITRRLQPVDSGTYGASGQHVPQPGNSLELKA